MCSVGEKDKERGTETIVTGGAATFCRVSIFFNIMAELSPVQGGLFTGNKSGFVFIMLIAFPVLE
jgi:hypothetical protein